MIRRKRENFPKDEKVIKGEIDFLYYVKVDIALFPNFNI